ncbi:MAG: hypothetical protein HZB92_07415 [Euryarchaeota archaeon]|nr:hypothetical protein [Euryarchaeota archaeon]
MYLYKGLWLLRFGEKVGGGDKESNWENAKKSFYKALKMEPENKVAIKWLNYMGVKCKSCEGDGVCFSCNGSGICATCEGNGTCPECKGTGQVTGWFGKKNYVKFVQGINHVQIAMVLR